MNCPVCETQMKEIEKYGVEIDICPQCKGVWLDRGEIDKIATVEGNYHNPEVEHYGKKDQIKGKKKKKESFLGELFDF
jgi:Zn-finger nucleic acid-binding protein